ncbi:MAG: uncharacterized protein JWM36_3606 [Hyphomicrobiales bacterium]|nr:uncharacterized protein [Hyphomicrobiales bacterium]
MTNFQASPRANPRESEVAPSLVNPLSGLANDYLNHFNEVVMIIEQLPEMPELIEDLLAWRPLSYDDYFTISTLPERDQARQTYEKLDSQFKRQFQDVVDELDHMATGSVVAIRRHVRASSPNQQESFAALCAKAGGGLRQVLKKATSIINSGLAAGDENAQRRADRLLAVKIRAMRDVDAFVNRPRFARD